MWRSKFVFYVDGGSGRVRQWPCIHSSQILVSVVREYNLFVRLKRGRNLQIVILGVKCYCLLLLYNLSGTVMFSATF